MPDMNTPLVETRNLKKYFKTGKGILHAVEDVNLKIFPGKTLGVVGESGCGKSTLGRTILRLQPATSGEVLFNGENILKYKGREMSKIHLNMQMVFQDPYSSLDPRMSVRNLISEPVEVCGIIKNKAELNDHVREIMEMCGLPADHANLYPHELDGGLRQRVGLARAMAVSPKFIVCDEPVSAL
ncbi:MAG: ATP-binding cassette domain-containing protein, partial [Butyricicoccus sp.]